MNSKIPCDVILDLLPLYAEGLTSKESSEAVREHIRACPSCRKAYSETAKSPENDFVRPADTAEYGEVEYLKRIRRRSRKKIIIGVCSVICVALAAMVFKLYIYGSPSYSYVPEITQETTGSTGAVYKIEGFFSDSAAVYSRYKIIPTGDGGEKVVVYGCLPSPWNRSGSFSIDCSVCGSYLDVGGMRIMADGTIYNAGLAQKLYDTSHPYVGDMPANNELALALGIQDMGVEYINRLHTEKEPYGWEFVFSETQNLNKQDEINQYMEKYAVVLLALVGNCHEVMWSFGGEEERESSSASLKSPYKITSEDADELLGKDVKSFSESPEQIMRLLKVLDL